LKISPSLLSKYSTVQDQLIYLILIPHVIFLFFIYTVGYWIAGNNHRGISMLISIAAYIYIVYAGWYGTLMVPIINAWFPIVLLSFFGFFILTRVFHPLNIGGASGIIKAGFDKAKVNTTKQKEIERLEKENDLIRSKIKKLNSKKANAIQDKNMDMLTIIDNEIKDLEMGEIERKSKIDALGG
jgi:cell division protein FtsB